MTPTPSFGIQPTGETVEITPLQQIVTVLHPDGTHVVGISAEAPEGELDDSEAYAAMRTLRFEG